MNRALLEQPFAPAQIRQRKGRNGVLDYVEGHNVIHRLNEALDGAWSFEVTHHEIREDEVLVLGRLSAEHVTKMQFGVSQVTREKGSGQPISLGDDLKAAATDALKKCATFLGVGLHLYGDRPLNGPVPAPRPGGNGHGAGPRPPGPAGPRPASPTGEDGGTAPNGDRATDRQLDAILRIGRAKGLAPADVEAMSLRAFNRKPGALTRSEASSLIKELSNLARRTA
ncbi:MAG: hypothetical protein HY615_16760 [Candidatus Rokubacteria bacterium]|nr:hypothetical protein [Candidatus Rokubacteria bacterium]